MPEETRSHLKSVLAGLRLAMNHLAELYTDDSLGRDDLTTVRDTYVTTTKSFKDTADILERT